MKYSLLLLFALSMMLISSCEESDSDLLGINGDWELLSTGGGITGGGVPVPWDNISINDNHFELYNGDLRILEADMVFYLDEFENDKINFDFSNFDGTANLFFDEFEDKFLFLDEYGLMTFDDGCCDLFNYTFQRF